MTLVINHTLDIHCNWRPMCYRSGIGNRIQRAM